MFGTWFWVVILAGVVLSRFFSSKKFDDEMEEIMKKPHTTNIEKMEMKNPETETRHRMVAALEKIGCNPTVNEEGNVEVYYQGDYFVMRFGGIYAEIWNPSWLREDMNEPDIVFIREAVNRTNRDFGPTVVMYEDMENATVYLHTRYDMVIHPDIKDMDEYLRATLGRFFTKMHDLRGYFREIKAEWEKTGNILYPCDLKSILSQD